MLQKWKLILTNWINCYLNESTKKEENVTLEAIVTIISHLRENLSLDESKSSLLEAHTIEEFIAEKYPGFTFENESIQPANDEELYIAASLLLFFVCVISKDVDIKTAMCSKLGAEDQETIMKFSKSLMECSSVTLTDVQAAITEACGQESAAAEGKPETMEVAETPPPLRSLHSEVRRLQAALDAERFDRNFLQEELSRTNLGMDKLLKEQEQYKLEIVNLKGKMSMCCGEDAEIRVTEGMNENTAKLTQELHDMEDRLIGTEEKLDDLRYERDTYKAKVDELKQERSKWLSVSQEEALRSAQLAEELEMEKRNIQSLKDYIAELQQHNRKNNGLDSSQLECDDPDASMSLHNVSVCSEACANVIEVQLGEERAKIVVLNKQIETLQKQMSDFNQEAENEKLTYKGLISEKDDEISSLKHRINEEIEEKNKLNTQYNDQLTKFNNDYNELDQQFKNHKQTSAATIEEKIQEIQSLQEEKLSLIQSLSDETTKLENVIKDLKIDINTEKYLNVTMEENYEKQLMKLSEKVLNRNNELVELQNNVFDKSELIEKLHLEIRNEKQEIKKLKEKASIVETKLQQKTDEAKELQRRLVQNVEVFAELNREIDELKDANVALYESNRSSEDAKGCLMAELESRDNYNEEIRKEIENITNIFSEDKARLMRNIDERNTVISSLQMQIQNEAQYKVSLENKIETLDQAKLVLSEEVSKLKAELANLKIEFQEKERMIYALDLYLKDERYTNKHLKTEYDALSEAYNKLMVLNGEKDDEIKTLQNDKKMFEEELQSKTDELQNKTEEVQNKTKEIMMMMKELQVRDEKLQMKNEELEKKKDELEKKKVEIVKYDQELLEKEAELLKKDEELLQKDGEVMSLNDKIFNDGEERRVLLQNLTFLNDDKNNLERQLMERCDEMLRLQQDHEKLCKNTENNNIMIEMLEKKVEVENRKYVELEKDFDMQTSNLLSKLNDTEKSISEYTMKSKYAIEEKELRIQIMQHEVEKFQKTIDKERENVSKVIKEREALIKKLSDETSYRNKFEEEYQNLCLSLDKVTKELSNKIVAKNEEISALKAQQQVELESLTKTSEEKVEEIKRLEAKLAQELETTWVLKNRKDQEIKEMMNKIEELNSLNDELEIELKKEIDSKAQAIEALQRENEQLHFAVEEDNSNHEVLVKEKDTVIERLEEHLKVTTIQLESIRKDYEGGILMWEKSKIQMRENLEVRDNQIEKLTQHINELNRTLDIKIYESEETLIAAEKAKDDLKRQIDEIVKESNENDLKRKNEIIGYVKEIGDLEIYLHNAEREISTMKEQLDCEKSARDTLESEKAILLKQNEGVLEDLFGERTLRKTLQDEHAGVLREKNLLTQKIMEANSLMQTVEEEKKRLLADKERLERMLNVEIACKNELKGENENLTQKLFNEKSLKVTLEKEKDIWRAGKEALEKKMIELCEINDNLTRKLIDEKSLKVTLEKEIDILRADKEALEEKMIELCEIKENLQKERTCLLLEKEELTKETEHLKAMFKQNAAQTLTMDEIKQILELLDSEETMKQEFHKEKKSLMKQNNSLTKNIEDLTSIQEVLVRDKEILMVEKEDLAKRLSKKTAREELEFENSAVSASLSAMNDKFATELYNKQEELNSVRAELKTLKTDYKKHEDLNVHMASLLSSGLEKLFLSIKNEDISNEVLLKLINCDRGGMQVFEQCGLLINIAHTMTVDLSLKGKLIKTLEHENRTVSELKEMFNQKELQVLELQSEVKRLQQVVQQVIHENKIELSKQSESCNTQGRDIQNLQLKNKTLTNELNDVKVQLEVKVHSLKEKLVDNENLTDKLKKTYECQIENLNVMVNKLTSYLKDKTVELETVRKEKERLQQTIDENNKVIRMLDNEIRTQKLNQEKLISDFESERLVLKNMVTVTESVMEDTKIGLNKVISDHIKTNEAFQKENKALQEKLENDKRNTEVKFQDKEMILETALKELYELKSQKESLDIEINVQKEHFNKEIAFITGEISTARSYIEELESENNILNEIQDQLKKDMEYQKENSEKQIAALTEEVVQKGTWIETLQSQNNDVSDTLQRMKNDLTSLEEQDNKLKTKKDSLETELLAQIDRLTNLINGDTDKNDKFKSTLKEKLQTKAEILDKVKILSEEIIYLIKEKNQYISKLDELKAEFETNELRAKEELEKLKKQNAELINTVEQSQNHNLELEQRIQREQESAKRLQEDTKSDKLNLDNKCSLLQEYQIKAEKHLNEREIEICALRDKLESLRSHFNNEQSRALRLEDKIKEYTGKLYKYEQELYNKDKIITNMAQEKDTVISTISKELVEERAAREKYQKELETKATTLYELRQKLEEVRSESKVLERYNTENNEIVKAIAQRDTFAMASHEKASSKMSAHGERERDRHQVSTPTSDLTHSSLESNKTINDLEKIIHDKNRSITTLQSDITYMKLLMAESENKLLDVTKELEISKENCQHLSSQLKKIVQQKNEEIGELKKQVSKLNMTETQSKQIIKVSAKYQAIILKRIADIKSNSILKELTNFANTANSESESKRGLAGGIITMEDLENFLETTDKHLKRCSEKQLSLQKERDRLYEVNRINESEIINLKKFLTELSVSFKTFSSVRDLYAQKLSRVVSVQRTVRREILNLEGHLTDAMMCKLERGYAAIMQDLSECTMNLERWMERCICRTISPEKIKQAFTSDMERTSLTSTTLQNAGFEVQLEELDNSFQKLLEEVMRAPKGEGAKEPQAVTVMEVRAEYEDKLNRMKAKMKQLYQDQIAKYKENQKEEVEVLERELQRARDKLAETSRAYEGQIRTLTTELWSVGEKFLMKKDEAEWLRRKNKSGSLMSLQYVHSSGLMPSHREESARPSDTCSLRSLPVSNPREKREGRGLHMSDEEGEVFDNRWLKELSYTPRQDRRESQVLPPGQRLSELRWRNSLCPPHLKSSYPAEMQFRNTFDEEEIKCTGKSSTVNKQPRKEVGITAYKKPGPPTPSKQAGRLSATDAELRESLRVDAEPGAGAGTSADMSRKTSTPSRIRALFRGGRNETEGTPRSKRLRIFRKK